MHIVILGGGYAGILCAQRIARRTRGRAAVTLVSASPYFVDRIRLHQQAAGQSLVKRELAAMVAGRGIALKLGRVTRIDPQGEVVLGEERLRFDRLVVALGSRVDVDAVPGIREHAFTLEEDSATALSERLPAIAARGGRLLVIGGGLTGIEGASELAEAHPGLRVTLLSSGELGEGLSEAGRAYLHAGLVRQGVTVEQGRVRRIHAGSVELEDRTLPFEACLWAGGFVAPEVVRASGLPVNARGQVRVDAWLRAVGHENVYAIGDAAEPVDPKVPVPMGCKSALPMGAHLGESLARAWLGRPEAPFHYRNVGYCISLGRRDGLFQPTRGDGSPIRWVVTGRLAAVIKEGICRFVIGSLRAERGGLFTAAGQAEPSRVPGQCALP